MNYSHLSAHLSDVRTNPCCSQRRNVRRRARSLERTDLRFSFVDDEHHAQLVDVLRHDHGREPTPARSARRRSRRVLAQPSADRAPSPRRRTCERHGDTPTAVTTNTSAARPPKRFRMTEPAASTLAAPALPFTPASGHARAEVLTQDHGEHSHGANSPSTSEPRGPCPLQPRLARQQHGLPGWCALHRIGRQRPTCASKRVGLSRS